MNVIMTALAPLESRHPRLGQSLWWLWFMRPRCLHAHALRPACSFARRAVLGRCLSPPSLRPRAPGVGLALGAGRPWGMPPPPSLPVFASLAFWGLGFDPLPPTRCPLAGSAHPQTAQWGGGSPCGRGAHHTHSRVPLVPSGVCVCDLYF